VTWSITVMSQGRRSMLTSNATAPLQIYLRDANHQVPTAIIDELGLETCITR